MTLRRCPRCAEAPELDPPETPGGPRRCLRCGYRSAPAAEALELAAEPRAPVTLFAPAPPPPGARPAAAPRWGCPNCQEENGAGAATCARCGLPREVPLGPLRRRRAEPDDRPVTLGRVSLPRPVYYALLGGALAALVHAIMCGVFDFGVQVTVHELGHALAAWCFGILAVPLPVVGFTIWWEQSTVAALGIWAGLGGLCWWARAHRRLAVALGIAALLYPALAFTPAHRVVVSAAGHGSEVLVACLALWLTLEGRAIHQDAERVAAAMCAWLLLAGNLSLFWRLSFDRAAQHRYRNESVMGVDNDFVHVSQALGLSLPAVSLLFVCFLLLAAGLTLSAWWRWRWRPRAAARAGAA